jgi:ATP-dependent DNA helicase PIF1
MLGNGTYPIYDPTNSTVDISKIVNTMTTLETSIKAFVLWCYPELQEGYSFTAPHLQDTISIYNKAILCALNDEVDEVNKIAVELMNGEQIQFFSADEVDRNSDHYHDIPIEYLNSISIGGLPPHILDLKIGCPVILLRNINPKIGLCNGTKLIVHKFIDQYCIELEIVTEGPHKGNIVAMPRIDFTTSESDFPFILNRRQFPIRLAFAMTINKAQGQSLKRVGIYLKRPVFAHGQLYVALSRAAIPSETRVLIEPQPTQQDKVEGSEDNPNQPIYFTGSIVYKEVFSKPT